MSPPISQFMDDYQEIKNYLMGNSEITMATTLDNHFRKVFLLSCASFYEKEIQETIREFVRSQTDDERLIQIVHNKAINRQYHTYFDWKEARNVNNFLALFGSEFKIRISNLIREDTVLDENMRAFLEIGHERNKMVHENFLVYRLEKTFDEIRELNEKAIRFVEFIRLQLIGE